MRNHFDYMKTKYTAWLSLKNKTGNIYDEFTNTSNLSAEEWDLEIQKNKNVKSLKTTTLHFPELCAQLFDGTLATGIKSVGPNSTVPRVVGPRIVEPRTVEPRVVKEPRVVEVDADIQVMNSQPSEAPCSSRPSGKNKRKAKQPVDGVDNEILGVLKMIADKVNQPEPLVKLEVPTIEDCQNKLNDLGWNEEDPLYGVALVIFCDSNDRYREGWMKLKPERCANWVKNDWLQ